MCHPVEKRKSPLDIRLLSLVRGAADGLNQIVSVPDVLLVLAVAHEALHVADPHCRREHVQSPLVGQFVVFDCAKLEIVDQLFLLRHRCPLHFGWPSSPCQRSTALRCPRRRAPCSKNHEGIGLPYELHAVSIWSDISSIDFFIRQSRAFLVGVTGGGRGGNRSYELARGVGGRRQSLVKCGK